MTALVSSGEGMPRRAPDLISSAIRERAIPVESCLFVGSTDTDLTAAVAAGVDTIHPRRPAEPPVASNPWFDALSTHVTRYPHSDKRD